MLWRKFYSETSIQRQFLTYKCMFMVMMIHHTPKHSRYTYTFSCLFISSKLSDPSSSIYPSFPFLHPPCGVLMSLLLQLPLIVGHRQLLSALLLKRQRAQNSRSGHQCTPSSAAWSSCCPPNICTVYILQLLRSRVCLSDTVCQQLLHADGCVLQWEAVSCLRCAACATLEQ